MSRTTVWVILGFILGIGVVAIYMVTSPRPSISPSTEETPVGMEETEEEVSDDSGLEVTIKLSEYIISPSVISVDAKKDTTFILKNLGFTTHNFVVDELGIYSGVIPPGESKTITFTADKSGEYDFYCSIGDHRDNGMEGVLIVK
jgi:uncharacterized cupredoxin-like copper-binding protein